MAKDDRVIQHYLPRRPNEAALKQFDGYVEILYKKVLVDVYDVRGDKSHPAFASRNASKDAIKDCVHNIERLLDQVYELQHEHGYPKHLQHTITVLILQYTKIITKQAHIHRWAILRKLDRLLRGKDGLEERLAGLEKIFSKLRGLSIIHRPDKPSAKPPSPFTFG